MVHRTCLCQRTRGSRIVAPPAPASRSVTSTGAVARGMCQVRGPEMSDELRVSGWGPATSWRFLQKEAGSPGQGQRVRLEEGGRGGKGQARDARMLGKAGKRCPEPHPAPPTPGFWSRGTHLGLCPQRVRGPRRVLYVPHPGHCDGSRRGRDKVRHCRQPPSPRPAKVSPEPRGTSWPEQGARGERPAPVSPAEGVQGNPATSHRVPRPEPCHCHLVSLLLGQGPSWDQQGLSVLGLIAGPLSSGLPLEMGCQEVTPQGVPIQLGMGSGPPGGSAHLRGARSCHLTLSPGAALTEPPPREQHR